VRQTHFFDEPEKPEKAKAKILTEYRRLTLAKSLIDLMLRPASSPDGLSPKERRLAASLGLATVKDKRAVPTAAGMEGLAAALPPELGELRRACAATAARMNAGELPPALHVEPPAAAGAMMPAATSPSTAELCARAALGLLPGVIVSLRPATPREAATYVGVGGAVRVRLDIVDRAPPTAEIETLIPDAPMWIQGWPDIVAKQTANRVSLAEGNP